MKRLSGVLLMIACFVVSITAQGNRVAELRVAYPLVEQTGSNQQANIYFTPYNENNQPIDIQVGVPGVLNVDGQTFTGQVQLPQTSLYLALVVDTSGSMSPNAAIVEDALLRALRATPASAQVALITFNESVVTRSTFRSPDQVENFVLGLTDADFTGGTCLYDAMQEGLDQISQQGTPGRRAMIVVTDGRDEILAGGDLDQCSSVDAADVIARAEQPGGKVPVYTIGMRGGEPVDENTLSSIASGTGGLYSVGQTNEIVSLFDATLNALSRQRVLQVPLCLSSGQYSGFIALQNSRDSVTAPVSGLTLQTNCTLPTPTAEPVVSYRLLPPVEENNDMIFTVENLGNQQPASYEVFVTSGGVSLGAEYGQFTLSPLDPTFRIPIAAIPSGGIEVSVEARDASGTLIGILDPSDFNPVRTPTPPPAPTATPLPGPRVDILSVAKLSETRYEMDLNLPFIVSDEIAGHTVRIKQENLEIHERRIFEPPTNPYIVNLDAPLPPGDYTFEIELRLRDPAIQEPVLSAYDYFEPEPPPISLPQRIINFFTNNALPMILLVALAAGLVWMLFFRNPSQKKDDEPQYDAPPPPQVVPGTTYEAGLRISNESNPNQQKRLEILKLSENESYYIGRAGRRSANQRIDLELHDETVAPLHASIWYENGAFHIAAERGQSIRVNKQRLHSPSQMTLPRNSTTYIQIGRQSLKFNYMENGKFVRSTDPMTRRDNKPVKLPVAPVASGSTGGTAARKAPVGPTIASNSLPDNIMALLTITQEPPGSQTASLKSKYIIRRMLYTIGRKPDNNLQLSANNISGQHAVLSYNTDKTVFIIQDLDSSNGTWVSGAKLPPNSKRRLRIEKPYQIKLAENSYELTFEYNQLARPDSPQPAPDVKMVTSSSPLPDRIAAVLRIVAEGETYIDDRKRVTSTRSTIGSKNGCTIRTSLDSVSPVHLVLFWHNDSFYLVDPGSDNGTWLNGQQVTPKTVMQLPPATANKPHIIVLSQHKTEMLLHFFYSDDGTEMVNKM